MIPSVAQLMAARDVKGAREKIGLAVKTTMVISIPCAVDFLYWRSGDQSAVHE